MTYRRDEDVPGCGNAPADARLLTRRRFAGMLVGAASLVAFSPLAACSSTAGSSSSTEGNPDEGEQTAPDASDVVASTDQELTLEDPACTQVRMKAVSGDLELTLPEGLRTIALHAHTVSGDASLNGVTNDPAAPCSVQMDSVSGDLSVE